MPDGYITTLHFPLDATSIMTEENTIIALSSNKSADKITDIYQPKQHALNQNLLQDHACSSIHKKSSFHTTDLLQHLQIVALWWTKKGCDQWMISISGYFLGRSQCQSLDTAYRETVSHPPIKNLFHSPQRVSSGTGYLKTAVRWR